MSQIIKIIMGNYQAGYTTMDLNSVLEYDPLLEAKSNPRLGFVKVNCTCWLARDKKSVHFFFIILLQNVEFLNLAVKLLDMAKY